MLSLTIARIVLTAGFVPAYVGPGAGITFLGSFFVLLAAFCLLAFSLLTWPFRAAWLAFRRWRFQIRGETQRVVVVGLDGLDPDRVDRLMAAGRLPHLQQLAREGTCSRLGTTLPPISPVAWSSFQTGVNPGKHNIFDFLNRDLRTCLPELSSARIVENPRRWWHVFGFGGATIRMLRRSQPFWKILGDHGIFSTILRVPISFPPERFFGLSLSAMCTPDIRGTQGSFTVFSTDPEECQATTGGLRIAVQLKGDRIEAMLPGPPVSAGSTASELQARLILRLLPDGLSAELTVGTERHRLTLNRDTPWIRVEFRQGLFTRVSGVCRFRLQSLQPVVRLYVSPIHLDPERPAMPISYPLYYSIYLAKLHDAFATLGLAEDTWGLNSGAISEQAFLDQAWAIHEERERMFFDALRRMRRGLTVCVFDGPDRIQHMFYRHDVPDHPANRGRDVTQFAGVLDDLYARMDQLVGRVRKELRADDVLLVLSDHGFCSFSRGVNLNVWLREHGYLAALPGAEPGDYLTGVDWSQTRAYAFGLSGIYINQQGREARGIVAPQEVAALKAEIAGRLSGLIDPETGESAIRRVYDSHEAYSGPYVSNGPDLLPGYQRGYRASWETAVGRIDGSLFHDNTRHWSGDHCVDPALVPGVLFANRALVEESPTILDLAPTILKLFGVPVPAYMDGRAWSFAASRTEPQPSRAGGEP